MNVLVYSGTEVFPASLSRTLSLLRSVLTPNYAVQTISSQAVKSQPWKDDCALLVFPASRRTSSFDSRSLKSIMSYVENGGSFLGLSTGVSVGSSEDAQGVHFIHNGRRITPQFWPDDGYDLLRYNTVDISFADGQRLEKVPQHGDGQASVVDERQAASVHAHYIKDGSASDAAIVSCQIGQGSAVFCLPSIEYSFEDDAMEKQRVNLVRSVLAVAGLKFSGLHAPRSVPLPQFLTCAPERSITIEEALKIFLDSSGVGELKKVEDANDTFQFHPFSESWRLFEEARSSSKAEKNGPRSIVLCTGGNYPSLKETPLFDIEKFFKDLALKRSKSSPSESASPWNLGDLLLYGEVVTSTQTMIDKNPKILNNFPVPLVSIASHQLAGRGRGSNSWVSPEGCLQFSVLVRLSLSSFPSNKLVFVQYLFALAVVEACRDGSVLGGKGASVRLKWPNDIYAVTDATPNGRKKIGGVLVNTSFSEGNVDIVIGCGLNVTNPPPIMSLSELDDSATLELETVAATILAKFDDFWTTFVSGKGSFEPFMDTYLDRWLHSDQQVTLSTVDPPQSVRIVGINSDHGLLRTLPETAGWPVDERQYIDLQPDGNSYDLMSGLIRTKK